MKTATARITEVMDGKLEELGVAGAVVGVAVGGEQLSLARGTANLNTGEAFTEETGWLLGSVTKVLTTTMVMRLVDQGVVDLDAPVTRYVPDFVLGDAEAMHSITVRMLLNHTNGIDADVLMPAAVRGHGASKSYVDRLAKHGVLFQPGTFITYGNAGFVLAARIVEHVTGLPFELAVDREVFVPCGMSDATAVQSQAMLRRTAIGADGDFETGQLRATRLFSLPESAAGAGATPIVTVADMLAFGRMHLRGGIADSGERVLSEESARAMLTPTFDVGLPQVPPVGLGWWLPSIAGTTAAWHGGGSPGGSSSFTILPEHDAVIASFVSGPGGLPFHDQLHNAVIEELTGQAVAPLVEPAPTAPDPEVAGDYASFQLKTVVTVDDKDLLVASTVDPCDDDHRTTMELYGVVGAWPAMRYTSVAPDLYAPAGVPIEALGGIGGRMQVLSTLKADGDRRAGLFNGLRYTPRVES